MLCFVLSSAPPAKSTLSSFICPFGIHNDDTIMDMTEEDKQEESVKRGITLEEFEEDYSKLVWCLPKSYTQERPPFVGE